MFDDSRAFVSRAFLRSELDIEYKAWAEGGEDAVLLGPVEIHREWITEVAR